MSGLQPTQGWQFTGPGQRLSADGDSDIEIATQASHSEWGIPSNCDPSKREVQICGGCGCCIFLIGLIMILCSFKGLHATEFAILRNSVTGVVSFDNTYHGGRNFIGFWNEYLVFPATLQSIEWLSGQPQNSGTRDLSPMSVRTADGLMVELGIVAQYTVVREKIPQIYQTYKTEYEGFFISNLRSALQSTVAEFKATELYTDRFKVSTALLETCKDVCRGNLQGFLSCWGIQLLDVRLDQRIENANVRQQVEMQKQATEEMKQKASLIRAKTTVLEADFDRQVKLVNVEADAAAVNITRKAEADAAYNMQEARAEVLRTVQNTVKSGFAPLTNSELLKYMEQGALIEATAGPMIYGDFQSATVFTQTSGEKTPMVRNLQEL